MIKKQISGVGIFIFLLLLLLAVNAKASITAVNAVSSPSQLLAATNGFSQITWTVTENAGNNSGLVTIFSPSGIFRAPNNTVLGTTGQVQKTINIPPNAGLVPVQIGESLTIPLSVIQQALQQGFNSVIYERDFSDGVVGPKATVTFSITSARLLSIRRVQMEYDDSRSSTVVSSGSEMRAHAIVSYSGTGLLEYSWEVASPPSTLGQPVFVPLISRKQYLLSGDRVVLRSPRLPTNQHGIYLLRLSLHKPVAEFELPVLRYAVNNTGQARIASHVQQLRVSSPAADTLLSMKTLFAWQPVVAASAYQLEIYDRPVRDRNLPAINQRQPVTGMLVPAARNRVTVGNLSRAHLLSGQTYYWRVVAFSEKGQAMARSQFRRIQIP